jgi:hypothetical protein
VDPMESLDRLYKHMPGIGLLSHLLPDERLDVLILKGHLIIEAELVDICARLLKNPPALEKDRISFNTRLNLVCALLEVPLPASIVDALRDLNRLRNSLAHNLELPDFEKDLNQFFRRFDEFEGLRRLQQGTTAREFIGLITFPCGMLHGVVAPDTETETDQA